jgi:hypothetical protein
MDCMDIHQLCFTHHYSESFLYTDLCMEAKNQHLFLRLIIIVGFTVTVSAHRQFVVPAAALTVKVRREGKSNCAVALQLTLRRKTET